MSESITYDATGLPVAQTAPAPNTRRAHWLTAVRHVRPGMEGKFWQQTKSDLVREMEGILHRAEAESREFSEGEQRWYAQSEADLKWLLDTKLRPYEEEQDRLRDTATPHGSGGEYLNGEGLRARLARLQQTPGATGRRFADLFGAGDMAGFKSSGEFFSIFAAGLSDPRMLQLMNMQAATMQENGVGGAGSAVVPSQLVAQWLDASLENEIVRPRCTVIPMTTLTLKMGGIDVSDNSEVTGGGASVGGFRATWSNENTEATPQMGKFRSVLFSACKLLLYAEASAELAADGNDFENQIGDAMIRALGFGLDDSLLSSGTGAGQPLAILRDPALITVPKESGQAARTILYENILAMFARLHPASMPRAVWIASSTALPALLTLQISLGSAGTLMPAVKEQSGKFSLLGMELIFSEKLPVLGTKGDLLLVDLSQFVLALRKDVILEKSNLPGWTRDVMSFRVILRADGKGLWNQAQIPKNGDSRSWAVALATRA